MTTPPEDIERTLVICDGGLTALVAAASVSEDLTRRQQQPHTAAFIWVPGPNGTAEAAATKHADLYGLTVIASDASGPDAVAEIQVSGITASAMLLRAGEQAAAHGCRRVIWPIQASPGVDRPDINDVARVLDRALLASRLVSLDAKTGELGDEPLPDIRIETPYADLTDAQIIDLARDLAVPIEACWWWGAKGPAATFLRSRWSALVPAGQVEPKPDRPIAARS